MIPKFTQRQKLQILLQHPWNWVEEGMSTGDWTAVKMRKGDDGERRSGGEVIHRRRRTRGQERETPWRLGFGRWGWGFWGAKLGFLVQVRCVKVGVLSRVTVRKHVEVLGPQGPHTHSFLEHTFWLYGLFLGWGGGGRRQKRGRKSERLFE
jgi:hypothetical protein